jgi:hypothetical protein
MEAKTMTSEMGQGPAEPFPVTDVRSVRPAMTSFEPMSAPAGRPAGETAAVPLAGARPAPVADPTGDERVDEAMARLAGLDGAPVARHVEIFEDVHRRLQDALVAIDPEGAEGPQDLGGPGAAEGREGADVPPRPGPPVPRPPGPPVGRPGGS